MARRLDRLTRYAAGEPVPMTAAEMPTRPAEEVIAASIERAATRADPTVGPLAEIAAAVADSGAAARGEEAGALAEGDLERRAGVVLEAIIGSQDYVGIRYL